MLSSGESGARWFHQIAKPQWMALTLAALGWTFESYDSYSLALTIPVIAGKFGMSKALIGSVLSLTAAGQMIGGICFGYVADWLGRVRTAFLCICIYSIFSGLLAFVQSVDQLFVLRICGAFGMGGMWTAGAALVAESWPAQLRGRGGALMQMGLPIGAMIAIGVSAAIGSTIGLAGEGWRFMYILGAMPAVILFFVARVTPESPIWLSRRQGGAQLHDRAADLDSNKRWMWSALTAFLFVFCLQYVYWGVTSWTPTYLVAARGMKLLTSLTYVLALQLGALVGFLVFGAFVDKLGRRPMFAIYLLIGAVSVTAFVFGPAAWLLAAMFCAGFSVNGVFAGLGPFIAELLPDTRRRGLMMGLIYNGGRLGGISAPALIGVLASGGASLGAGLGTTIVAMLIGLVVIGIAPETKGREIH